MPSERRTVSSRVFTCLFGAQIFAIFEMLTTLGNSRVTFQVHLNEMCVSGCCMNCYKTGVAYAHRGHVGFVNGASLGSRAR